jgi:hypothetical protein
MTTSALSRAGGACLLGGLLFGAVSVLAQPTISSDPAPMAAAISGHSAAMVLGGALNSIGAALLVAGLAWWAWLTYSRAPRWAVIGGVLGVLGILAVLLDDGLQIAAALMGSTAHTLDGMSAASGVIGPISVLNDVGMIVLAVASLRRGIPRALVSTAIIGSVVESAGFATGARYLAVVGLVVLLAGLAGLVRSAWAGAPDPTSALAGAPA